MPETSKISLPRLSSWVEGSKSVHPAAIVSFCLDKLLSASFILFGL
jgi:hypothetical protein